MTIKYGKDPKSKDLPRDPKQLKSPASDVIVSGQPKQKPLRDGAWVPLEASPKGSVLYGEAYYDVHGKLVVLPGRRIYIGDQLQEEFSINEQGERHGAYTRYNNEGKPAEKGHYKNGALDGEWIAYDKDGAVRARGHYRNGKKIGKWKVKFVGGPAVVVDYGEDNILYSKKAQSSLNAVLSKRAKTSSRFGGGRSSGR